jgi:hypothetical protein
MTSAALAAASAPASRRRVELSRPTPVATEKPLPPSAVTTTPASPGPPAAISPAVEHPMRATPAEWRRIPASSASRS